MKKESNSQKKDNKSHQVNTRLTEEEYQMLSRKSKEAGLKNSEYVRRVINESKVEVRFDSKKVIHEMHRVQNNINKAHHMIMERLKVDEQKIKSLENIQKVNRITPPFRIKVEDIACDLADIKKILLKLK